MTTFSIIIGICIIIFGGIVFFRSTAFDFFLTDEYEPSNFVTESKFIGSVRFPTCRTDKKAKEEGNDKTIPTYYNLYIHNGKRIKKLLDNDLTSLFGVEALEHRMLQLYGPCFQALTDWEHGIISLEQLLKIMEARKIRVDFQDEN